MAHDGGPDRCLGVVADDRDGVVAGAKGGNSLTSRGTSTGRWAVRGRGRRSEAGPVPGAPSPGRARGEAVGGAVLVGDSITDIQAGRAAGVEVIAYANKPGKDRALGSFEPDALITSTAELVRAS
ncbi:HAD family hydrolase [Pseudonocardia sp. RS010]|uniref:HAD family hydrolase n=1 Tax=Pseudonocardia sp. RS010 TaxID=3385979 RepID=UPI00399F7829